MTTFPTEKIIWLENTTSTSDFLSEQQGHLQDGTVVVAEYQSNGRGQGSHVWISERGSNLTFSILLKYGQNRTFMALDQQLISMASALGITDFLKQYNIEAKIKMPNDIYIGDKKICGMLIENSIAGKFMLQSIIGIGIDINQTVFPDELPNPVSMKLVTGIHYDTKKCLGDILRHLYDRFDAIWTEPWTLESDYKDKLLGNEPVISSSR